MAVSDQGNRFIRAGAEIVVGTSTVLISAAGIEPWNSLSPIITPSIIAAIEEFGSRALGNREKARSAGVLLFATMRLEELQTEGKAVRDDGFFSGSSATRSSGEEVIEAVMNVARDTHEEKKLKYLGNLLAQIAVSKEINRSLAHELISVASGLSYTQMCILCIAVNKERYELRQKNYQADVEDKMNWAVVVPNDLNDVLFQALDLWSRHIVSMGSYSSMFPVQYGFVPSEITCQVTGFHLYKMMQLYELPKRDVEDVAKLLSPEVKVEHVRPDEQSDQGKPN